ncbi:MAG: UDP-N-acetylmuramoyl-L-alanyl-D-glutamate--2,6-diaminopimelate ligase [Candidatus Marinimicrobia bacterium]|nr:UDP-N-acetylmuramoyl-L-alanyl-D-glutamate--2,6-diaminopimelate ligase [Candidatus Neomarinimicrobiota bacterium]
MKLLELLKKSGINARISGFNTEIHGIEYDSRKVTPGDVFVAIKGLTKDGHAYIQHAIQKGASAIICEKNFLNAPVPIIVVPNSRKALSCLSQTFYDTIDLPFRITGITGTNGKTTLTFLLRELEKQGGFSPAISGTLGFYSDFGNEKFSERTTPESRDLHKMLHECKKRKIDTLIMEVSSIALTLNRVDNISFDTAIFTNLTQDHLDFHKTMDDYFSAKKQLFSLLTPTGVAIINIDDPYGMKLYASLNKNKKSCSLHNPQADYYYTDYRLTSKGLKGILKTPSHSLSVEAPLIGDFNAMNVLQAVAAWLENHPEFRPQSLTFQSLPTIPGRMEIVQTANHGTVIIDFAHTPDALEKIFNSIQEIHHHKIWAVFGCGGDRDKAKRPYMGHIVEQYADEIIITNDNPRTENPDDIIRDILQGISFHPNVTVEKDRKKAIHMALEKSKPHDLLLLLGKGAEEVMEIREEKIPFNDKDIVLRWLNKNET